MTILTLTPQPLTPTNFAPYGHVVSLEGQAAQLPHWSINGGNAMRYELLPDLQLQAEGGVPMLAIFRVQARQFPLQVTQLECHAWGSQTFIPLGALRFVVVVAPAGRTPSANDVQAFVTDGCQGVVLAPGTWHHALLAVDAGDFVVIERKGAQVDCTLMNLPEALQLGMQPA